MGRAIHLAMWLSPRFSVEVTRILARSGGSGLYEDTLDKVETEGRRIDRTEGFIYAVTAPRYDAVKLGWWGSDLKSLKKRYKTCFTADMQIVTRLVADVRTVEAKMLKTFTKSRVDGEVFVEEGWAEYIEFINNYEAHSAASE